jgi:hypothetical protein
MLPPKKMASPIAGAMIVRGTTTIGTSRVPFVSSSPPPSDEYESSYHDESSDTIEEVEAISYKTDLDDLPFNDEPCFHVPALSIACPKLREFVREHLRANINDHYRLMEQKRNNTNPCIEHMEVDILALQMVIDFEKALERKATLIILQLEHLHHVGLDVLKNAEIEAPKGSWESRTPPAEPPVFGETILPDEPTFK